MSELAIAVVVFAFIFGSALLGLFLRATLPEHHLSSESKDVVKLAMGLIATMAALVLGLLTASAKSSFDVQNAETVHTAADIIRLDRALARYGPETKEIRDLLKRAVAFRINLTWPEDGSAPGKLDSPEMTRATEGLENKIRELSPRNDFQRELKSRALQLSGDWLATRWLRITRLNDPVPLLFLVVLTFWLSILFGTFGLFTPQHNRHCRPRAVCSGGFRLDLFDPGDAPAIRRADENLPRTNVLRSLPTRAMICFRLD